MTVFGSEVLFTGDNTSGHFGLWVTDGTAAGTHELTSISGANANGLQLSSMTFFKGKVLFNGVNAGGNHGLWLTDGTAAGTHELAGITGANAGGLVPFGMTVATLIVPPPSDLNGDGTSDILWRNNSGDTANWQMTTGYQQ